MDNKIEILRAICFDKDDLEQITNIKELGDFQDIDIEFMIEFKKIYELGTDQLEIFLKKLDDDGHKLDTYSILYYTDLLLAGPFGATVRGLTDGKKYFVKTPDSLGVNGNKTLSNANTALFSGKPYSLGAGTDVYNKLPGFCQTTLTNSIKATEEVFRGSLLSSTIIDNTRPIVDKKNSVRYLQEPTGEWQVKSNGTYLVKDVPFYLETSDASKQIFDEVKSFLEDDENFRLYKDKKQFGAFDSEKNQSKSKNYEVKKKIEEGDVEREISLDLYGNEFDSDEKRSVTLDIINKDYDKQLKVDSNEGQLGNMMSS